MENSDLRDRCTDLEDDAPMNDQEKLPKRIHVMGICGSGMGSFAGMLQAEGADVRGSDQGAFPPMSDRLTEWGIPFAEGYGPQNLEWGPDLVIVGNVIRAVNPEAESMRERDLPHMSFPEALGNFFLSKRTPIVVTGTHGKTTTTSLVSWLLEATGGKPGFLIGGTPANFGRSFQLGEGPCFVVEGDEYDTAYFDKNPKFLHYRPQTAILTSIEFDHADIYRDLDHVISSFDRFMTILPEGGLLAVCGEEALPVQVAKGAGCTVETYGFSPKHDWFASETIPVDGGYRFNLSSPYGKLSDVWSPMTGRHNVLNTLGAFAAVRKQGVSLENIAEALVSFQGVGKRQEVKGVVSDITVIDDYAHHPTAVKVTIDAIKDRYPGKRIWGLFEAESNTSRRRVFQDVYPEVLGAADVVVLAKPLKKNDKLSPEEQIDVMGIVQSLEKGGTEAYHIPEFEDIVQFVGTNAQPGDVILAMSGRNFGGIHQPLIDLLQSRFGQDN